VTAGSPLGFDAFAGRLCELLDLDAHDSVTPTTGLYDDLGLDSFQAFQVIVLVEQLAGLVVAPVELPELYTVGDSHRYYLAARAWAQVDA
jgi:acyl carrier protein